MPIYAYSTMLYLSLNPRKAVEELANDKVPIEISYDNFVVFGGKFVEDKFMSEIKNVVSTISNHINVVHTPYDEMIPEIALSTNGLTRFIKWFNFVQEIGAKAVVVHTLYSENSGLDLNLEFFRTIAKEAKDRGIHLAIENRLEKKMFGSQPKDLITLISLLGEGVGICLDIGHANINKNLDEFLSRASKYITVIHTHDNDGHKDHHNPPYTGVVEWNKLESWVARTMFKGFIVFEVVCRDAVNSCRNIVNYLKSLKIANIS